MIREKMELIEDLFVEYIGGGLDKQSEETLEKEVSSSPEAKDYWLLLNEIWQKSFDLKDGQSSTEDRDKAFGILLDKIHSSEENTSLPEKQLHHARKTVWTWLAFAASLVAVALLSYVGGKRQIQSVFSDIVIEAPVGSRTFTTLPDGTRVCLSAGSKITYSQGFGVCDREVDFVGEGYFDVVRNEELPFQVHCNDISICVLGTTFSVRDNPDDYEVTVNLFMGKLLLENKLKANDRAEMVTADRMIMDKRDGVMHIKSNSDNAEFREYSENGYMVFEELLLSDILNALHLNYGVNFTVKNEQLLNDRYRGIFIKSEQPVEDILKALALASEERLHYEIKGNEIELY